MNAIKTKQIKFGRNDGHTVSVWIEDRHIGELVRNPNAWVCDIDFANVYGYVSGRTLTEAKQAVVRAIKTA